MYTAAAMFTKTAYGFRIHTIADKIPNTIESTIKYIFKIRDFFKYFSAENPKHFPLPPANGVIIKQTIKTAKTQSIHHDNIILPKKTLPFLLLYHKDFKNTNKLLDK